MLAHGCGGGGNAERGWVAPLNGGGYATFVVDSFTGRGLRAVCTQGRALIADGRAYPGAAPLTGGARKGAPRWAAIQRPRPRPGATSSASSRP